VILSHSPFTRTVSAGERLLPQGSIGTKSLSGPSRASQSSPEAMSKAPRQRCPALRCRLSPIAKLARRQLLSARAVTRMTVGDVAACFAKTPGQLAASLSQLTEGGWIEVVGKSPKNATCGIGQGVFPTVAALRTLPAYYEKSDVELASELDKLKIQ
jgi:hypothetical protein